jgi:hypothetical protein
MKLDLNTILKYTEQNNTCLEWTRCYNTDGYPRANFNGNYNGKVHRIVWELHNNKSAKGYVIRHTCDNPRCINPKHLVIGTDVQNVQDRQQRNRAQDLKQKDVLLIQQLYKDKIYTVKELQYMFSVSKSTIYYTILHRKVG